MTRSARVLQVLSCFLIAAGSVTCSGDKLVLPDEGDPAAITVVSGNNQNGTVGLVVTDSVVVRVTDSKARPVVDARVQFNLGTNGTGGDLIPDTAVTDADGRARARWVLGTKAGVQLATARVVGFTRVSTSFSATALADVADTVFALSGDGQTGTVGVALAESLVIRVNDQFGNPVSAISVGWSVSSGGGSVSAATVATGANGQAAVQRVLGPSAGSQSAAATVAGVNGSPVGFTHNAVAGGPTALLKIDGDNQTAPAGTFLAESLDVQLVDGSGNGVAGRQIAFTPSPSNGSAAPTSVVTDVNGMASSRWTLGGGAGAQSLIASGVGFSVTFNAMATSDVPTQMAITAGNNQTATGGTPVPVDPTVRVRDVGGNNVPNVSVTFTVTGGGGTVAGPSGSGTSTIVATDAGGLATLTSWTLGGTAGANTMSATASGPGGPLTGSPLLFTATGTAGPPDHLTITTQPPATVASSSVFGTAPVIQVRDAGGNPINQANINVTVSLASGSGTLNGTKTQPTNSSGQATFSGLSISGLVGPYTLDFNSGSLTGATSATINLTPGAANKLFLTTQPSSSAQNGVAFAQQPVVQIQDAAGNPVSQSGVSVTALIATGGGNLVSSNNPVTTNSSGVATFTDLAITGAAGGRTLDFNATGLTKATSSTVTIGAGGATKLAFGVQPSNSAAGSAISPAVTVLVQDNSGNTVSGANNAVTVALGNNPSSGTLGGTLTVNAVNGVATFSDLTLDKVGTGYTLTAAASGLSSAPPSNAFNITPGSATQLVFTQQPSNVVAGASIAPAITVTAQDAQGNTVTGYSTAVSLALGNNAGGGTLTGGGAVTPVAGVATFAGASINRTGTGYTLVANSGTLTKISNTFDVSPGSASQLIFTQQPSNSVAGSSIAPPVQVAIEDALGNILTTATTAITLTIGTNPPGNGVLTGGGPVNAVNGIATFNNLKIDKPGAGYTLIANGGGLPAKTSAGFDVSVGSGNQLVFIVEPGNAQVGQAISPAIQVQIQDGVGNPVGGTNPITLVIGNNPGGANISGGGPVSAVNGIATFSNARLNAAGSGYTLTALASGLLSATSGSFDISAAGTTTTINSDNPDPSRVGQAINIAFSVTAVAPGSGTPTGTVTVSDGTVTCQASVAAGTCQLFPTTAGAKTITASYAGDGNFTASTSAGASHSVLAAITTTLIISDNPDPSVVGQATTVVFDVTVNAPGDGVPTGNITISSGADSCVVPVSAGSCSLTFTSAGAKTITASYPGDGNFNPSQDTEAHTVNKAASTVAITSDLPDPSGSGQAVAVDYTVVPAAPGAGTPTGNVVVTVSGSGDTCTGTVAAGTCQLVITTSGSNKTITATYNGDANFLSNSDTEQHDVNSGATTTTITSTVPSASVVGQLVTISYSVTPGSAGTPTGTVTVSDGTQSCNATVAAGQCNITFNSAGTRTLVATYGGDANFGGSTSAGFGQQVNSASTTTGITGDTPDPSTVGQAYTVSYAVNVTAPGSGTPTGSVIVSDGLDTCNGTVAAGSCSLTSTSTGAKNLVATYQGDGDFTGSASSTVAHTVNQASTTTTITADNPDPSGIGANVTVDFTVTSAGGTPTGNVTVADGLASCTGTVAAGTCTITLTVPGPSNLTATYAGDANFSGSTSAPEPHNVALSNTSTTITAHPPSPSVVGQQVTVSFSVSGGIGTPTGNVTVSDGTLNCNAALSGGSGSCNLTFPSAGNRTLTASYGGDVLHGGSTSPGVSHQVDPFGPADPASSTGNVPNGSAGVATVITVQAKDQFGNNVTVGGENVVVTVSGANSAGPITANDNGDGTYTASYTPANSGPDQVDITMNGTAINGSPFNSAVAVGPATTMQMFAGNNQTGAAGGLLPVHPSVLVRDSHNNPVSGVLVAFTLTSGGGGISAGSATTNSSGQADVGWTLGTAAGSNTLTATKTGLTGSPVVFSATATATAASQLVITQQPGNAIAASPIAPPVQVAVRDQFGNTVTTATTSITVAIGTNPPGNGVLSGTRTLNAVNGIATFSTLSIDKPGTGYTLTVNGGGLPQKTSSAFDVQVGNGNQVAFIVQPSNDVVGAALSPAVEVEIQDAAGNRIPTATNPVTLALNNNPGGATLTGGGPVNAVGGVATFSNVRLDQTANGYTLVASASGLQSDISTNLDISKASTVAAITSDLPDPSVVGQAVTVGYSVTVAAPGSGTPSGTVTVSDGAASCQASVAAGSCQLTSTGSGPKTLTATYAGDANFKNSNSPGVSHTVNPANTTTVILSDTPDPSTIGQAVAVDFDVSVAGPGSGIPTGNVTVSDGVDSCTGNVTAGTCNITLDTPGSRTLTATYAGNATFNGSTSVGVSHSVGLTATTTDITSDNPDPSVAGESIKVDFTVSGGPGTPTGSVTVNSGSLSCTGGLAAGGKGSCNITFSNAGAPTLTATYSGDATHGGSVSPGESHQVNPAASTVTITSDTPDPSTVGEIIPVSYSVVAKAPGSGTPTGTVTITVNDGSGDSCAGSVSAGTCDLTLTTVGNGKTLTATYSGDANYLSDSDTEKHDVHQAATTATITSDNPDPSSVGQAVIVNFTVTSTGGTPTGNVTVSDGINSCTGTVATGTCTISLITPGSRTLTATYAGDANFLTDSDTEPHSVGLSGTTTSITTQTPDPSVVGQAVAVDFTVTGGIATPTGSVTVSDGSANCTATLSGGSGSCNITLTTAGTHTLTATYVGDLTHAGSTSTGSSQTVNKAATTATITADNPDPSSVGQAVDVDFTVTSAGGTPTGNVTVSDGVDSCTGTVAAGTCAISLNTPGAGTLTATYAGDANFLADSDTETHSVGLASALTSITSHTPNPSVTGQGVDVDVTVTSSVGTPTGSVSVTDGSTSCNATLSGGSGTCTIVLMSAGPTTLTATYGGDATHSGGSSGGTSHTVNQASTAVSITSDTPDPSGIGESVTVDFTVAVSAPGAGTPTGSVTVSDGINSCSAPVAAGSCNIALLTLGSRPLTATYGGDADFAGDASAAAPHAVTLFSTTTTITSHTPAPSVVGQAVDVNFTVAGGLTPTGTVTVTDGVDSCQGALSGGSGSCTITLTTAGTRTLTADYGGDGGHGGSTSPGVSHTVDPFGPVDPGSSTAVVPDGQGGQQTSITIQARDQFGNAITSGGETVVVTISGANADTAVVTDNGDGTYTATYTPGNTGTDTIAITINGTPIQGSPFSSNIS